MNSIEGRFLVASPHLTDDNFFRSVLYVVRHNSNGAYALMVNRPTMQRVRCVMEMLLEQPCAQDGPIYCGGPVEGPLVTLHDSPQHSDLDCMPGLYMSTCQDQLKQIVNDPNVRMRMFDGYAGWSPQQLDKELAQGGWLVTDASCEEVLAVEEDLWEVLVRRVGRNVLGCKIDLSRAPEDPAYN